MRLTAARDSASPSRENGMRLKMAAKMATVVANGQRRPSHPRPASFATRDPSAIGAPRPHEPHRRYADRSDT